MPYYRHLGDVPRKRHSYVATDDGYLFEELMGQEGFAQESSLLYHLRSPSAIVAVEAVEEPKVATALDHPLQPRHLRTGALETAGDAVRNRTVLFANDDVQIAWFAATSDSDLYRDATGDQLVYVQSGTGTLESSFGSLTVGPGDYVVVPTAATHRWRVGHSGPLTALVLESAGHVRVPRKYLTDRGQFREGAPFSERDLRGPDSPLVCDDRDVPVLVRTRAGLSRLVHATHPFDVVAWDGCVWPFAFSIHDFEPIVGARHQPPPVHQTFEGHGFVVCSFVPRPFDFGEGAVKVPYHHANVDSDEVLFYSAGDFMSRAGSGIGVGSISYHPAGFVHGPQPGSVEGSRDATRTEEVAVMVDTFAPLGVSETAREISDAAYPWTWAGGRRTDA
jgi:homogentisate 1,2-dioxygenase